jgi:hypothetical protein
MLATRFHAFKLYCPADLEFMQKYFFPGRIGHLLTIDIYIEACAYIKYIFSHKMMQGIAFFFKL